jgi:uncharacterized protein (TIGR02453 family)
MAQGTITRQMFRFLRDLAGHNDRDWFNANKQRYIDEVRDPLLQFITEFGPRLAKISPHLVADPRPTGGSLFRIYRDTRFSADKRPYKTHAAMSFRHAAGGGPGFYLHLEPGMAFMGAGLWHPEPDQLKMVRDAITSSPKRWQTVRKARGLAIDDGHEGDRLKRPPAGYDPEHPFIEDLKRKSFTASTSFTEAQACAPDFVDHFAKACREKAPLMEFLCRATGLKW